MSDAEHSFAYEFGDWLVEPDLNRIRQEGREIQLEPRTSEVLRYLLEHAGEIVSIDELLDTVWAGRVVEPNAVHRNVNRIRRALGDNPRDPTYIETISKRGYRTVAPAKRVEQAPADSDLQAALAAVTPPYPAYDGDEPYTFVCYSHQNRQLVYEELLRLRSAGINVWYDEGISPGAEWNEEVANAVSNCTHLLYFISPDSVDSTYCRNEVSLAQARSKSLVVVYLAPTELPASLELSLGSIQALHKYAMNEVEYARKLIRALTTPPGRERAFGPTRAPGALPSEHPARTGPGLGKKAIAAAAIGALVLSVGLLLFREPLMDLFRKVPENSITVARFDHHSSRRDAEWVGGSIESHLRVALPSAGFLVVGSPVNDAPPAGASTAAYLLTGSVTRMSQHIRVTIELFSTDNEYQVFSRIYDIEGDEAQVVQSEIASRMAVDLDAFRRGEAPTPAPAILANLKEAKPTPSGGALQSALSQQQPALPQFSGFDEEPADAEPAQAFPSFDSFDEEGGSDE